ncbi:MAG TPA: methyltransferase [Chthonomonadaceae bacterium]|nr:methyltransferase [Chthonomonadaceae bacterium]
MTNPENIALSRLSLLQPPTCDDRSMYDLWESVYYFPAVTVADELGVFSLLEQEPRPAKAVAEALSLHLHPTIALLGLLTSLGFLVPYERQFHLTEPARNFLLPNSPYYWDGVLHPSRTDKLHQFIRKALVRDAAAESKRMTGDWAAGQLGPELAERITRLMHSHSFVSAMYLAQRGSFEGVRRMLDVGGGSGCYCIALAQRYPEMECTVLELPVICTLTDQYVARYGLQQRIHTHAADMFNADWPPGHDAIFFSEVFHDWNEARCHQLARHSFERLPAGGRIYVHEILLSDTKDGPLTPMAYFLGLTTLTEGRQFTAEELRQLLEAAGFINIAITPSSGYYSLVSAEKPTT